MSALDCWGFLYNQKSLLTWEYINVHTPEAQMNSHNCFIFGCTYQEMKLVCYNCHFTERRVRRNLCYIVTLSHSLFLGLWVEFPSLSQPSISSKVLKLIQYCFQPFNSTTPCLGGTLLSVKGEPAWRKTASPTLGLLLSFVNRYLPKDIYQRC